MPAKVGKPVLLVSQPLQIIAYETLVFTVNIFVLDVGQRHPTVCPSTASPFGKLAHGLVSLVMGKGKS